MKKLIFTIRMSAMAALSFLVCAVSLAGVPGQINYQGKLTDPSGELINQEYDITFTFFTGIDTEGAGVWTETHPSVRIENGLFNVMLGSTLSLNQVFQANDSLWLEIAVDSETLLPRQNVLSVGYAIRTEGFSVDEEGNVGIGTATPEAKLHVLGDIISEVDGTDFFMVPGGTVIMWSGALSEIPSGWQLCDGNNGTLDLSNRFLRGVADLEEPGNTGGAASHSHTFSDTISSSTSEVDGHTHSYTGVPAHTHSVGAFTGTLTAVGNHTHTMDPGSVGSSSAGAHTHTFPKNVSYGTLNGRVGQSGGTPANRDCTNSTGAHTHTLNFGGLGSDSSANHTHTVTINQFNSGSTGEATAYTESAGGHKHTLADDTAEGNTSEGSSLPPYFKVAYIMAVD